LSKWTGYHAEIKGSPVLEFWPTPRITLNHITIRQPRESGDKLLGSIESLSSDFSLIDALRVRKPARNGSDLPAPPAMS
ncbi:hypothetical protein ACC687_41975, partial [Rhizobium ruizarguesonis]